MFSPGPVDWKLLREARTPLSHIKEDAMSSIQGVSSAATTSPVQLQSIQAPAVARDKDHDGDVDKAGAVDNDKGNHINLTA